MSANTLDQIAYQHIPGYVKSGGHYQIGLKSFGAQTEPGLWILVKRKSSEGREREPFPVASNLVERPRLMVVDI